MVGTFGDDPNSWSLCPKLVSLVVVNVPYVLLGCEEEGTDSWNELN